MGFRQSSSRTADECTAFPHPDCSICERPIQRREEHADSYQRGRITGSACGNCVDLVNIAAQPILKALIRSGYAMTPLAVEGAIERGDVGVLVSIPLPAE